MKFASVEEAILRAYVDKSPALRSCKTHLSCERFAPFAHIEQGQHGVGAIAIQPRLLAMQQVGQLVAVVYVTRAHAGAVYQAAVTVYADVQLHAKVPLIAFLALMHFRVAALLAVLSRRWRRDQRSVHDG